MSISNTLNDENLVEQEDLQSNKVLIPPLDEDNSTCIDDDEMLNNLLNSLHSTKVRCLHKYTDEKLRFMHKHHEFNHMLESYVDVSIYNGRVS